MECVRYEWKKFIAFRFFWLLCVVAFLFNLWNLSEQAKMSWPPAEAVKELYADLKRQPEEERERWLKELKENKISSYTGNPYAEEELYKKFCTSMCRLDSMNLIWMRLSKKAQICRVRFSQKKVLLHIGMHRKHRKHLKSCMV